MIPQQNHTPDRCKTFEEKIEHIEITNKSDPYFDLRNELWTN
ncbi:hypothetical protein GCM10011344_07750 [Dokdonia pacifica]|uniref:Uncharacterized protein n=1 Tax=Dokdonia pacifica TaxID=1627892 RepID=A0A238YY82_9FLAO|nr:hypothetical protein GCM10011344_07750 [Dokdonia pacifica]SNR75614.1 hypothetical protein SAMN06265376_102426 [Dokdonia pacifica]